MCIKIQKSDPDQSDHLNLSKERFQFFQVALVTFANGRIIGVYAPIFAGLSPVEIAQVILIFMFMIGIWCIISLKMVENKILGEKIKKYSHILLPFVLIVIGIFIIISKIYVTEI